MDDVTGLTETLVGLDGVRVLDVSESPDEVCITVERTVDVVGCPAATCGLSPSSASASRASDGPTEGMNPCVKRISGPPTASRASSTIACGSSSTPAGVPGTGATLCLGSEPALPESTRRASKLGCCRSNGWSTRLSVTWTIPWAFHQSAIRAPGR